MKNYIYIHGILYYIWAEELTSNDDCDLCGVKGVAGGDVAGVEGRVSLVCVEHRQRSRLLPHLDLDPWVCGRHQRPIPVPMNGEWGWGVRDRAEDGEGGPGEEGGGGADCE